MLSPVNINALIVGSGACAARLRTALPLKISSQINTRLMVPIAQRDARDSAAAEQAARIAKGGISNVQLGPGCRYSDLIESV